MQTLPWDSARHLRSAEDIAAYLDAALEDADAALFAHALAVVAQARGLTRLAQQAGLSEDGLRAALSSTPPDLSVVLRLLPLLNVRLRAVAEPAEGFAENAQSPFDETR